MKYNELKNNIWEEIKYKSIYDNILRCSVVHIKGLSGSLKTLFLSSLFEKMEKPILAIFPDREDAEWVAEEMASMIGAEKTGFFPGGEAEEDSPAALNPRRAGQQMGVIRDLLFGQLKVVTVSANGILFRLSPPEEMREHCVSLSKGSKHDLYSLVERLMDFGFSRESMIERPGEISLRGGILDIFPYTGEEPHRFEFFDDQIESIRTFDLETQQSTGEGDTLITLPLPSLFSSSESTLFSYFPADRIVFVQDPELVLAEAEKSFQKGRKDVVRPKQLEILLNDSTCIHYHTFSYQKNALDFGGKVIRKPGRTIQEVRTFFESLKRDEGNTTIYCQSSDQKQRLSDFLETEENSLPRLQIEIAPIQKGFILPSLFLTVYSESDLFGRTHRPRRERFKEGLPIRELSSLSVGDFVVHVDYGIGKYLGLQKLSIREVERECLTVEYLEGDKLYVPVDKMQRVQKYAGKDGAIPALSKLGGNQWEKLKARTKESIKNVAKDLISIYSARQILPGFAFSADNLWQRDLESGFPYDETADQSKAIEDVKSDLEQARPMDRLVCGDVGYGKTEVAIRAAFKVASDGKQVAMLVPTTILAQQHFRTFQERLSGFPFTVEMLSRFRNSKEQKEIIERMKKGRIDIVIGTHRLFSKDVLFKDLGLLIIDEEHRFGVRHKERLKAYRKTVDVLALSATPIPRTLYLSLMDIRDMSVINTAPKDRQPIITEVLPFSEEVVSVAIQRELSRGGQIFFVHNRIQSIYAVERMVQRLVPGIRTAVAHGKMDEHDLEKVMLDFTGGKYDCLVATMIIESGLDLPHANTLLVNRADRFGLAQLYQLRGRVGRSEKRAYAYLFTPPFHFLTQEAVKRLRTIEEFTELGSGFQIAMRDLEIRGAGNLLGVEQSGNMDAVGYDLYMKLVEEAVHELKMESEGKPVTPIQDLECQIDIDLQAILPDEYVSDESLRVNLYKRLASIHAVPLVDRFEMELKDRFGPLPKHAENLMEMTRMKILGQEKGFKRIIIHKNRLDVFFHDKHVLKYSSQEQFAQYLRSMIDSSKMPFQFQQKKEFGLKLQISEHDVLAYSIKFLQSIA